LAEKIFDIKYANALYDKNHRDNVNCIKDFLEKNDIEPIGRYGSWDYSGIEDVILDGSEIAAEIIRLGKEVYTQRTAPLVSVVIPIYNEEKILELFARQIIESIDKLGIDYELILCENGSTDRTLQIAKELATVYPRVRAVHYPEPNYGKALALGIMNSTGQNIVCFEIDFWDPYFVEISNALLKKYDAVVGSKRAPGARDRRPWIRRMITFGFNMLLKVVFGFQGTDTHGIKSFRRDKAFQIIPECQTGKDIFATELVLRMERAGLYMCEIPLEIEERRPPSIKLLKRVPSTILNLIKLWKVTRKLERSGLKKLETGPKISGSS
jgi:glycosyltransferase involved in cell wall biosynthesis